MSMNRRELLQLAGGIAGSVALSRRADAKGGRKHRNRPRSIRRDVCVLGGGSSGCYAAVHLQDRGASVAVIEKQERLGGHAETFTDPGSGVPIDIGVVVFENIPIVNDYFARFGVPLMPAGFSGGQTEYIDFETGLPATGYSPPSQAETGGALFAYRQVLAQYPYLEDGFQLPDPVPEELLRPFGDLVETYGLQAMFPIAFQYNQGAGNLLKNPAIFGMKLFGAAVVDSILGVGFNVVPSGTGSLYRAIHDHLGEDAFTSSEVRHISRNCRGRYPLEVEVSTPEGLLKISCKKLVVAFPPTPRGLRPLDFDRHEVRLFSRLESQHYSTGVVELSGLSPDQGMQNVQQGTTYDLPPLPGLYGINPTGAPGLWNVKYGSVHEGLSEYAVQCAIIRDLQRIKEKGTLPVEFKRFAIFKNHSPFHIQATAKDVARGFYNDLNALQGHRDTFYTGATFQTNDSSQIWRFTEQLLPSILV